MSAIGWAVVIVGLYASHRIAFALGRLRGVRDWAMVSDPSRHRPDCPRHQWGIGWDCDCEVPERSTRPGCRRPRRGEWRESCTS